MKTNYFFLFLLCVSFVLNSCQEDNGEGSTQVSSEAISAVPIYYESEQQQMLELDQAKLENLIANTIEVESPVFTKLKVVKDQSGNASIISRLESKGKKYSLGIILIPYGQDAYQIGKRCFCSGALCDLTISNEKCSCSSNEENDCKKVEVVDTGGTNEMLFE